MEDVNEFLKGKVIKGIRKRKIINEDGGTYDDRPIELLFEDGTSLLVVPHHYFDWTGGNSLGEYECYISFDLDNLYKLEDIPEVS